MAEAILIKHSQISMLASGRRSGSLQLKAIGPMVPLAILDLADEVIE